MINTLGKISFEKWQQIVIIKWKEIPTKCDQNIFIINMSETYMAACASRTMSNHIQVLPFNLFRFVLGGGGVWAVSTHKTVCMETGLDCFHINQQSNLHHKQCTFIYQIHCRVIQVILLFLVHPKYKDFFYVCVIWKAIMYKDTLVLKVKLRIQIQ